MNYDPKKISTGWKWCEKNAYGTPPSMTQMCTEIVPVELEQKQSLCKTEAQIDAELSSFVMVDASTMNITHVSDGFTLLTGYPYEEVVGRNCRFLQGPKTDINAVARIRKVLSEQISVREVIVNYTKNGVEFWNDLRIKPLLNANGDVIHFVAFQRSVTSIEAMQIRRLKKAVRPHVQTHFTETVPCCDMVQCARCNESISSTQIFQHAKKCLMGNK